MSGSSAAAAVVAGAAALLAEARPELDAAGLRGRAGRVRRAATRAAASPGVVDPAAASAAELVADPPVVAFGRPSSARRDVDADT